MLDARAPPSIIGASPKSMMTIGEVILYVNDLPAQVRFYRDLLGLEIDSPRGQVDFTQEQWVTFRTGACQLALHTGGRGIPGKHAVKFVFVVGDLPRAQAALAEKGVALSECRSPCPGVFVCDGTDPEGNSFSMESRNLKPQ
jgi:predicted enzyme related to lactoylglutathione lyase